MAKNTRPLEGAEQGIEQHGGPQPPKRPPGPVSTDPDRRGFILATVIVVIALLLIAAMFIISAQSPTENGSAETPDSGQGVALISEKPTASPSHSITPTPNLTATLIAFRPAANADWTPVERDFDGVTMVLVPAGCFMMGSTDEQIEYARSLEARDWVTNEQPAHEICFETPFWIDKYEVTNGQFAAFGGQAGWASRWTSEDLPREIITWFEARDFCAQRGGRLPTEAEWEYAARGPSGWIYPWGDEFIADNAVYSENSGSRTAPVGSRPDGVSWVGALDMSGNVWEWTSSLFEPYPYDAGDGREADTGSRTDVHRVLRGGSWVNSVNFLRAPFRGWFGPGSAVSYGGFRCARDFE